MSGTRPGVLLAPGVLLPLNPVQWTDLTLMFPNGPMLVGTIGALDAAGQASGGFRLVSGLPAWLAWIFIHIYFLIGFRNRLLVMFGWAWAWLTYQRGVRLVTRYPDAAKRTGVKPLIFMMLSQHSTWAANPITLGVIVLVGWALVYHIYDRATKVQGF